VNVQFSGPHVIARDFIFDHLRPFVAIFDLPVLKIKGKLKRMEDTRRALTLPRANLSGLTGEIDPITILLDRLLKNQDEFKGGTRF
jgi:hypothetical protein